MTDSKFDFWIQNNYNVLFQGKHGVGKTARIVEAFNRNNLKWRYFSASTLDPWVDFVGVPKEVKDPITGIAYLDLVRPKHFADDEVEAIFMDEYNRAPAKIRNATMELLQFKAINGKKFNNLRFIWAAVNPEQENENDNTPKYDVDKIDPAQKDRFEIHVDVPYKPDIVYFKNKYGEDMGRTCVSWWNDLNEKEREEVSPRRLDYAMHVYTKGGDLRDVLSKKVNVGKLIGELKNGNFRDQLDEIFKLRDKSKAASFIKDENNYTNTIKYIVANKPMLEFYFPHIPEEKQSNLIANDEVVLKHVINNMDQYATVIGRAYIANTKVQRAVEKFNRSRPINVTEFSKFTFNSPKLEFTKLPKALYTNNYKSFSDMINSELPSISNGTAYRKNLFKMIASDMYHIRGYTKYGNKVGNPFTEAELKAALYALNSIIEHTYAYSGLFELENVYGILCREYLHRFNMVQDYNKLHTNVKKFLSSHANLYL
jgi:hypothetical protein